MLHVLKETITPFGVMVLRARQSGSASALNKNTLNLPRTKILYWNNQRIWHLKSSHTQPFYLRHCCLLQSLSGVD